MPANLTFYEFSTVTRDEFDARLVAFCAEQDALPEEYRTPPMSWYWVPRGPGAPPTCVGEDMSPAHLAMVASTFSATTLSPQVLTLSAAQEILGAHPMELTLDEAGRPIVFADLSGPQQDSGGEPLLDGEGEAVIGVTREVTSVVVGHFVEVPV